MKNRVVVLARQAGNRNAGLPKRFTNTGSAYYIKNDGVYLGGQRRGG
jgi:hypothetical protein